MLNNYGSNSASQPRQCTLNLGPYINANFENIAITFYINIEDIIRYIDIVMIYWHTSSVILIARVYEERRCYVTTLLFRNAPLRVHCAGRRQWRQNEFERRGAPVRCKSGGGAMIRRKHPKFFGVVPLHFFGSKSTICQFGEHFRDSEYIFVSFLFAVLLLTVPPCPAISKSGGTCPVPYGVGATGCRQL